MPEPTDALPGSPEKMAILCQRFERNQHLFHPLDAKHPVVRPGRKFRAKPYRAAIYLGGGRIHAVVLHLGWFATIEERDRVKRRAKTALGTVMPCGNSPLEMKRRLSQLLQSRRSC